MKKTLLFVLALAVSICSIAQTKITFQLKNVESYQSIESAFVRLKSNENTYTVYSTPNGTVIFDDVALGHYELAISHISYQAFVDSIQVSKDGVKNPLIEFKLVFLIPDMAFLDAAIVSTVRAKHSSPTTFSNLKKEEIEALDQSKDFPFLLNMTPSTVISSDAGNGVGYTGVRIRGIDPTRVNITINGIPLNDGESQGVYWVNLPDLSSSTESVQIQRGVGTSTNGAAAFGASVNIRTNSLAEDEFTRLDLGAGSFNTQRMTLAYGTGRLENNWAFQLRGSLINSDGFIDRASSNLKSANLMAAKYWEKSVLKANVMLGSERTYQSWWGIPEPTLKGDIAGETRYINELYITGSDLTNLQNSNSKTYNYYTYENEVDNYNQNHYQLFFDHNFSPSLTLNTAAYVTTGKGYFEQFKADETLADYGIADEITVTDTFDSGDVIRRRWLDNTLIGSIASINYENNKLDVTAGGGFSTYANRHFGEAIATEFTTYEEINAIYYDNDASKSDANFYTKINYNFNNLIPYIDLQYRMVNYSFEGLDNNLDFGNQSVSYGFFNPKLGLTYLLKNHTVYGSYAKGNREPVRDDFRNNKPTEWPKHEQLDNIEIGYRFAKKRVRLGLNIYSMDYTNQLVLTGAINDVGEAIRTNVENSFRRGIEMDFQIPIVQKLQFGGNLSLSQNKIEKFTEFVGEWTPPYATIENEYTNTDISFSPNQIAAAMLQFKPNKHFTLNTQTKYVGKQYLDNTQSEDRVLDAFTNIDFSVNYSTETIKGISKLNVSLFANNVLNATYAPNGYTFSGYINGNRSDFNYLFPMAGINYMMKLSVTL